MPEPIIQVENLSKLYRIGLREKANRTFREAVTDVFTAPLRNFKRLRKLNKFTNSQLGQTAQSHQLDTDTIWALRDISFDVQPGEVIGIIGRNGAGKSTLLKILSRITEPTSGEVKLHGRVASLLEVGTGFHPELTGRENIYLNGTILGMLRGEIDRKFDEIVAFSEIEKFLDTPVKRYSSGMYVRLAFAVAAHLESEILLIDEVLAVGDAEFQKKCLGKMNAVSKQGRTVLFVSHNMASISRLCSKVLLLNKGTTYGYGNTEKIVNEYMLIDKKTGLSWNKTPPYPNKPHIRSIMFCNKDGSPCLTPTSSSQFGVEIEYCIPDVSPTLSIGLVVHNRELSPIFSTSPIDCGINLPQQKGIYQTRVIFPEAIFMPKEFSLSVSLYSPGGESYEALINVLSFVVEETASLANVLQSGRWGDLQILCDWNPINKID